MRSLVARAFLTAETDPFHWCASEPCCRVAQEFDDAIQENVDVMAGMLEKISAMQREVAELRGGAAVRPTVFSLDYQKLISSRAAGSSCVAPLPSGDTAHQPVRRFAAETLFEQSRGPHAARRANR